MAEQITCGEAYDFSKTFPTKTPKREIARQLISTKLTIKSSQYWSEDDGDYERFVSKITTILSKFLPKVRNHAFERGHIKRTDILIDLAVDCPALVATDSQPQSQDSISSTSTMSLSQSKVLEFLEVEPQTRHRKAFDDLGNERKRQKTDPIYDQIIDAAAAVQEGGMDPIKFIAYLGKRFAHKTHNYDAEKSFLTIYNGKYGIEKVDLPTCIQLKSSLQIGQEKYIDMRLLLKPWVTLHTYESLSTEIKTFLPNYEEWNGGIKCTLRDSLEMTLKRVLDAKNIIPGTDLADAIVERGLQAEVCMGGDGSGGHSVYNTPTALSLSSADASHMLVSGYVLNNVKLLATDDEPEQAIFIEQTPNSSEAERCLALIPQQETIDTGGAFLKQLDDEKIDVETTPITVDYPNLGKVVVHTKSVMSQLDCKAQCMANGLTACHCTMCTVSEKNAKDPKRIKEGFPMDRSILDLHQLFEELEKEPNNPNVLLSTRGEPYENRMGLKQKPQVSSDDTLRNFPVLHSYLRVLDYFENLTYRVNAGVQIWGKGKKIGKENHRKLKEAKNMFRILAANGPMHLKLDMPDSSGTGAGNTDTGGTAREFFNFKNRQHFIDLFEGTVAEKEAMATLHKHFSVILRLYSSKNTLIDVDDLEALCTETNLLLVKTFPWATQPPSIHKLLAHTAQRIRMNDNLGMGSFSEEGIETLHKIIRRFRELLARKNNLFLNLFDVWRALMVRSDPVIRSKKRKLTCSVCKGEGHTKRSCPKRDELTKQSCANEYDDLFSSFVIGTVESNVM